MTVRVLIVDDQAVVRAGLRRILEADRELTVIGEAADGEEAVRVAHRLKPDVVLMDIRMPRMDGLAALRRLGNETADPPRTVILTTFGLDEYVYEALRAGASGFLLKDAPAEDLINAVHIVSRGDALLDLAITRSVITRFADLPATRPEHSARLDTITPREREVFVLLAHGRSNAEIGAHLVVSEGTVKTHIARIFTKLGLRDRAQAVIFAYEAGLVRPGGEQSSATPRR